MTKRASYRYLSVLLFFPVLLLAGCGFHLRVQTMASPELKKLSLVSSDSEFAYVLEDALQSAGVEVQKTAPYQVRVLSYAMNTKSQPQATANVANYTVDLQLKWTLENASGQPLFLPRALTMDTSYQVANDVNIGNASGNIARDNLRQNAAMSIVRQLGSITSKQLDQWNQLAKARLSKNKHATTRHSSLKETKPVKH